MAKIIELELSDEDYAVLIEAEQIIGVSAISQIKEILIPKYLDQLKAIVKEVNDAGGKEIIEKRLKFKVVKGNKTVK